MVGDLPQITFDQEKAVLRNSQGGMLRSLYYLYVRRRLYLDNSISSGERGMNGNAPIVAERQGWAFTLQCSPRTSILTSRIIRISASADYGPVIPSGDL